LFNVNVNDVYVTVGPIANQSLRERVRVDRQTPVDVRALLQ